MVYDPAVGAAFLFLEKHAPGFLEHVSCGFCQFTSILGSLLMILPQAFFISKNTPLDVWIMHLVDFVNIWGIWRSSGLGEPLVEPADSR